MFPLYLFCFGRGVGLKGEAHRAASRRSVSAKVSTGQVWGLPSVGSPWKLLIDRLLAVATRQVSQFWEVVASWAQIAAASGRASSFWRGAWWLELRSGGRRRRAARTRLRVRDAPREIWVRGGETGRSGMPLEPAVLGSRGCSSEAVRPGREGKAARFSRTGPRCWLG